MDFVCGCFFGNKICSLSSLATTPTLFHSDRPMRFIVALVLSSMWFGFLGSNEWWNTKGEIYRTGECNPAFWMFLWPWPWLETYAFAGSAWFSLQVLVQLALSLCFVWYLSCSMGVVGLWSPVFFQDPSSKFMNFWELCSKSKIWWEQVFSRLWDRIIYENVYMKPTAASMYVFDGGHSSGFRFFFLIFCDKKLSMHWRPCLLGGWAASW